MPYAFNPQTLRPAWTGPTKNESYGRLRYALRHEASTLPLKLMNIQSRSITYKTPQTSQKPCKVSVVLLISGEDDDELVSVVFNLLMAKAL